MIQMKYWIYGGFMNIRNLTLTFFATTLLSQASFAMEESMKKVADHASQKLFEVGKGVIEKLPKSINIQVKPADLWWPTLSIIGAVSIYKGFSQGLSTLWKTDAELIEKKKNRNYCYLHAASKIIAGLLSLGGSYAVWNCR